MWLHACEAWLHAYGRRPGLHNLLPAWSRLRRGLAAGLREKTVGASGRPGPGPQRSLGISPVDLERLRVRIFLDISLGDR